MKPTTTLSAMIIAGLLSFAARTNAQNCNADFFYDTLSLDSFSITIQFTDLSVYPDSSYTHEWLFGDGTPASTAMNPVHTYSQGQYYH